MKCICWVHSILDLFQLYKTQNYFQRQTLQCAEKDIVRTAIITPFALYEFQSQKCSTPSNVSIDKAFHRLDFVYTNKDDVLIASEDEVECKDYFHEVFSAFTILQTEK